MQKRSNRWKDKRRLTLVTPYLELLDFWPDQDVSNRIRPPQVSTRTAFESKTNFLCVLALKLILYSFLLKGEKKP